MKIEWLGHSCFKIEEDGYSIVLDPYQESAMLRLKSMRAEANEVLCSHNHSDHNYKEAVNIVKSDVKNPFIINRLLTYHDGSKGKKRGENFITIIKTNEFKIAHLGDLGCELKPNEIEELKGLDVLMLPVGGFFTIGPKEAKTICDILEPKVIIPMHYKGKKFGPLMLSKVDAFTGLFNKKMVKKHKDNYLLLDSNTERQVAVLSYIR